MRLAFYRGRRTGLNGAFDTAVRWWTRGPYSHVEAVFGDGMAASASNRDGGVRFKRIQFDPARWDFACVDACEVTARRWFIEHEGQPYDALGLFGFVWRPQADNAERWFCSEAVAASIGFRDPWRFCPNTLRAALT